MRREFDGHLERHRREFADFHAGREPRDAEKHREVARESARRRRQRVFAPRDCANPECASTFTPARVDQRYCAEYSACDLGYCRKRVRYLDRGTATLEKLPRKRLRASILNNRLRPVHEARLHQPQRDAAPLAAPRDRPLGVAAGAYTCTPQRSASAGRSVVVCNLGLGDVALLVFFGGVPSDLSTTGVTADGRAAGLDH